jgi:serine/threonine protein kinase/Tol biopolymer transport system component
VTGERWKRVKALFQAAVERPTEERDAFLAAATRDDDALRREVESLLKSDTSGTSRFDRLPVASEPVHGDPLAAPAASMDHTPSHPVLTAGLRVGPYEIVAPLGAGAMGEVYRACDTTLNRDVAVKVLPERFACDADRLARFTREARLLATLNHPNIGAIYGFEESNPSPGSASAAAPPPSQRFGEPGRSSKSVVRALVLELVDGPTLADRIARGPIALEEALTIARQIADAVEAAHEKGIIHRDLKPANIKIASNGVVKVLDFGLAKMWDGAPHADLSRSPGLTATDIGERTVLGTPTYMSPEQARGQSLDRRTDIWSFGCVLYEMLTGRAPFTGDTISDTLAAILEREPDSTKLPADTPVPIRRLLRRCLEKDRKGRLDSAAGARLEIDDALASPAAETLALAATPSRRVPPVAIAVVAGSTAVVAFAAWALMRPALVAPTPPSRFAIVPPSAQPLTVWGSDRDLTLSPDGQHLVYRAGGVPSFGGPLMVRAIDQLDVRRVEDVRFALAPFISPDSQWIGFFENSDLKKVPIAGGPAITLCHVGGVPLGASWGDDNTIVFATSDPSTGLWRVSADGGKPTVLTTPDAVQRENDHGFPSMLPGGRGVLFTITAAGQADNAQVAVLDLTNGRRRTLVRGGSQPEYVDLSVGSARAGYLIYAAASTLRAVRFDPARLEVLGDPVTVVGHVMVKPTGAANYAVSRHGTLLYVPGGVGVQMTSRSLVWVDRKGLEEPIRAPLREYATPRVSPDGTHLALQILDPDNTDIWIWDLARETLRRLTFAPGTDGLPLWTRDGRRIIFNSERTLSGVRNLYSQAADGTGTVDRLTTSANTQFAMSITRDGTRVVAFENVSRTMSTRAAPGYRYRVVLLPLTSPAGRPGTGPSPTASASGVEHSDQSLFDGTWPELSPDGRYLAYTLTESGRREIYVRPFPQVDSGRWQISTAGGTRPAWARNGRELFYIDESNTLIAVPVQTSGSTFSAGQPAKVFNAKYAEPFPSRHYDVSPDGQRFLMLKDTPASDRNATSASMVVVLNWHEELTRLVSTNGK